MKKIDISTKKFPNRFTLVDDSDFAELSKYKWHISPNHCGIPYVVCSRFKMHRQILGLKKGDGKMSDHRNGDTLDNQRSNLRVCNNSENQRNRKLNCNSTSGYKGVLWIKEINKWRPQLMVNGKRIYFGAFTCPIKAAKAYDTGAKKYFGKFSRLNFPDEE